jgi:hypothetical protein
MHGGNLPAGFAITILNDIDAAVLIIRRSNSDFVEIAIASRIVIVCGTIEGRSLDQDGLCPLYRCRLVSVFHGRHIDGNAVASPPQNWTRRIGWPEGAMACATSIPRICITFLSRWIFPMS